MLANGGAIASIIQEFDMQKSYTSLGPRELAVVRKLCILRFLSKRRSTPSSEKSTLRYCWGYCELSAGASYFIAQLSDSLSALCCSTQVKGGVVWIQKWIRMQLTSQLHIPQAFMSRRMPLALIAQYSTAVSFEIEVRFWAAPAKSSSTCLIVSESKLTILLIHLSYSGI